MTDNWDRAMMRLSQQELELMRSNYASGEPNAYQAGFKASMELNRREQSSSPYGIQVGPESVGKRVTYFGAAGECESGVVTSFNDAFVFVRYGAGSTSQATQRTQLEWSE